MSLEGGLGRIRRILLEAGDLGLERRVLRFQFAIRATSGAIASAMSFLTSVSLNVRSILHVVPTCYAWRKSQARILA